MINCKNCGAPHTKTDKCNYCGTFYKPPPPKIKSIFDDDPDELPPIKSTKISKGAKIALIVVAGFAAYAIYQNIKYRRKPRNTKF